MHMLCRAARALFVCGALIMPMTIFGQDMKSLTLETALDIALKKNPRVLAAQKEVDAAHGRAWKTWWLQDPSFGAEYEQIPTGKGLGSFGERRLTLTQSIDFPTNIFF